jgi:hypothetical protein
VDEVTTGGEPEHDGDARARRITVSTIVPPRTDGAG